MLNKAEKAVEQVKLDRENAVLKELKRHYEYALSGINERLRVLQAMPETQSTVYHKEYQQTMKKQVSAILENLHSGFYSSLDKYRHDAYTTGFVGTMYDLHYQNVPLLIPINRDAVLRAVQHETKLTSPLYDELGIDIKVASKKVSMELSRGLSSGLTYDEIARNIRKATKAPLSRAKGIARTEGHRIQQASSQDAAEAAKAKGADIVKQWDATLDGDTRPNHRQLDGQIRELDEPFEVGGYSPMYPGDFGDPGEDCNCRCVSLKRARAALDEDELTTLKERAEFFGLDKSDSFADFEKKYLQAAETLEKQEGNGAVGAPSNKGKDAVRSVGRINRDSFKAITTDITTDEVIITDERIEHSNLHNNAYVKYGAFVPSVLADPDFVFRDKKPNTAVLIKRIEQDGKNLQLILRLHVSTDDPTFKNSIISFWGISETRRNNYERNREIVYRKE